MILGIGVSGRVGRGVFPRPEIVREALERATPGTRLRRFIKI
jgi:hypothetical protein